VIAYRELVPLLNSADGADQLDSLALLFDRGLVAAVIDRDSIIAITTTTTGDAALSATTLPVVSA
jgi:hypothetical protein